MSVDARSRTKIWLDTYLSAANLTMDDDTTPVDFATMYTFPPYPLLKEFKDYSVTGTKILDSGDNLIHGSCYYDGYLWFSTYTDPLRIIKMDPSDLSYEKEICTADVEFGQAIIAAENYIWIPIYNPNGLVKVNPAVITDWSVVIDFGAALSQPQTIAYLDGYLWIGGLKKVAKVKISDLSYDIFDYTAYVSGSTYFHGMTSGDGYIWATTIAGNILKIDPSDGSVVDSASGFGMISDDIAYNNGYLYFGRESTPYRTYRVDGSDLTTLIYVDEENKVWSVAYDNGYIWVALDGSPGKVVKRNLSLELESITVLPTGYDGANEIIFNSGMFVTCFLSPARVVRLNPVDLLFCIGTPDSVALPVGVGYIENVPITICTVDKSGITGTKLRWKAEAELRRVAETYPLGSLRTLERMSDNEQRLSSTTLYSVTYIIHYKRYS